MKTENLLNRQTIERYRKQGRFLNDIYCYTDIDSTNEEAKRLCARGAPEGTLITADHQFAGKGRRGRSFVEDKGDDICMSLILRPELEPSWAGGITLICAMAVQKALLRVCGLMCGIKWPNDIVVSGKKLCGILTEMSLTPENGIDYIIAGIGINVRNTDFIEDIREIATSVYLETGELADRARLTAEVAAELEYYYSIYLKTGDLSELKAGYDEVLVNKDRRVKVLGNPPYEGVALGIDDGGELMVKTETGLRQVKSGEVSVRGVYGYV